MICWKCVAATISLYCSVHESPQKCVEHMYECIEVEVFEYPYFPMDGILENCEEGYVDFLDFISDDDEPSLP